MNYMNKTIVIILKYNILNVLTKTNTPKSLVCSIRKYEYDTEEINSHGV